MTPRNAMRDIAERQMGLVTRANLAEAGVTDGVRRGLVRRGELVPAGRSVYRIGGVAPTSRQILLGACLDTGGAVSHRSAAWLRSVDGFAATSPVEVMVERPLAGGSFPQVRVHTTTWLPPDDVVEVDGIPCLGVPRTLLSLASLVPHELSYDVVRGAVDEAIRLRLATDPWIWWRLERLRRSGRNGVTVLESILATRAAGEVTESWLEREAIRVIRAAGLPIPVCQARIGPRGSFVARVDFLYPDQMLVIEVSGHRWHRSKEQTVADAARRRRLSLLGYTVLEYTYHEVVARPGEMTDEIRLALGMRRVA